MIAEAKKQIIKETVPVLEEYGTEITRVFYKNLFEAHPELLNIFNKTNQKVGDQPKALAMTVLAAARHIEDIETIVPAVTGIAHKHRALGVKAEHYPIVGKYLLEGIKEVLGDAATPEIIEAWEEYYGIIANVFIGIEKEMYDSAAWDGFKPLTVKRKESVTPDIVRFTVDSEDINKSFTPGQYITVKVNPEAYGNTALRHYSICSINVSDGITFAVKREAIKGKEGVVSNFMHDNVNEGDTLYVSAPAGDFKVEEDHDKLLFIAGGVGATPVMAMAEDAVRKNKDVKYVYSCINEEHQPFKDQMAGIVEKGANLKVKFSETEGFLNKEDFAGSEDRQIYICGSMGFMATMMKELKDMGIEETQIHFEPFGPKMSLGA